MPSCIVEEIKGKTRLRACSECDGLLRGSETAECLKKLEKCQLRTENCFVWSTKMAKSGVSLISVTSPRRQMVSTQRDRLTRPSMAVIVTMFVLFRSDKDFGEVRQIRDHSMEDIGRERCDVVRNMENQRSPEGAIGTIDFKTFREHCRLLQCSCQCL